MCFLFRAASRSHVAASERWMMFSSSSFSSFIIPPQTLGSGAHRKLIPLSVLLFLRAEHLHIKRNTPAIFRSPLLTRHSYCHGNKDLGLCREASESRVTNIFRCLNSVRREIQPFVLRNDDFRVPNMHFFFHFSFFHAFYAFVSHSYELASAAVVLASLRPNISAHLLFFAPRALAS